MKKKSAIIETVKMTKVYGSGENVVKALDSVSIRIQEGEFVAIMGHSGSGKSTLLNILACLDRPTSGRYILAGEDVSGLTRTERALIRGEKLGFVFQSYNLLPRLTAVENVMMPMMYQRRNNIPADRRFDMANEVLENVGLFNRAHHYPNQLSGGQQQRVAIARALINDPILILADEPTGNLDSRSSDEIIELLDNLHKRGRTIVMVTHEGDVAQYTQRILTIRDGRLANDHPNGQRRAVKAAAAEAQPA